MAALCIAGRTSLCEFERVPTEFLSWCLDPSLQRAALEERMIDLPSLAVGGARDAAYA